MEGGKFSVYMRQERVGEREERKCANKKGGKEGKVAIYRREGGKEGGNLEVYRREKRGGKEGKKEASSSSQEEGLVSGREGGKMERNGERNASNFSRWRREGIKEETSSVDKGEIKEEGRKKGEEND